MNNSETDNFYSPPPLTGFAPNHFEVEENDDPIPYIVEQLGIYERFVLHHYKHQKLAYANCLSRHPDDMANDAQNEADMYQETYGKSDQIHVLTPYDDYLYLRDELLKNPFEIGTTPEELLLAYMFCFCNDTRKELWQGHITQCADNIEHLEQLYMRIQDLLRSLYELWSQTPEGIPISHHETAYYSPVSNLLRFKVDPDADHGVQAALGRKKTTQLSEWHQYQFKTLLRKTATEQNKKWKSINAAIDAVIDQFEQSLSTQAEQNIQTFEQGRQDFTQLYQLALSRLQDELDKNSWLINHPANQERRKLAQRKVKHLKQLIREQTKLLKVPEGEICYKNLVKDSYTERTLYDWISNDPELKEEILLLPETNEDK
ncbi:hypothetical protein [Acinetobacter seifertii]|uniref:hypothetical protein n=1 Tax=Acinetobacter seifertii TaxID=1530123 RepID=UPI000D34DE00|nr:hypothetical protein [Acinetobacter seifertii]PTV52105.1 hypothetical protein DBL04_15720 [Acinetobacter seifertii]